MTLSLVIMPLISIKSETQSTNHTTMESKIPTMLSQNYPLNFQQIIEIPTQTETVSIEYIEHETVEIASYNEYIAPSNSMKSYMSYTAITNKSSKQYMLQQIAVTDKCGLRIVNDRYCIAVGSAYTTDIGRHIDLVLENGTVIQCILGDCKDDSDTDSNNMIANDGSLAEFIIDNQSLSKKIKRLGDISYLKDEWKSRVAKVIVYETIEQY